jgi:uncharacterized repeat protein (TIGR03806 family)
MKRLALFCLLLGAAPAPVDRALLLADGAAPRLADYRLFGPDGSPAPGVQPYALNTPLFSDHAEKARFLFLPPGTTARYQGAGLLDLPVGAVLVKRFSFPADLRDPTANQTAVETRLLIHRASGWVALSYVGAGNAAVLKKAGARLPVSFTNKAGQRISFEYAVPNQNQCKQCHMAGEAITPIGPTAGNLNRDGQLQGWATTGRLAALPAGPLPQLARWDDAAAPLPARARAWLEVNCAHCHKRDGFASNSGLYLKADEADPAHWGLWKRPVAAGRGSLNRSFAIVPGQPDQSILVARMESNEPGEMMPQFGRAMVHEEGVALVRAWIAAMPPGKPPQ